MPLSPKPSTRGTGQHSNHKSKHKAVHTHTPSHTQSHTPSHSPPVQEEDAHWGIALGSLAAFTAALGAACTFPFMQSQRDKTGCDALCYGSMQSTRSGLTLLGSIGIGRLSDVIGRKNTLLLGLLASIASYAILLSDETSLVSMWYAMLPAALNQNFSVLKALFADYNFDRSEAERSAAMGRLGMMLGLSFMVGPAVGATFMPSYRYANMSALILTTLSGAAYSLLPSPPTGASKNTIQDKPKSTGWNTLLQFMSVPAARSPGAYLVFFMRLVMGLAFSVFMTIWTVSLKERFDFGPKDHAYFMGWVGLWYALSQGFLAKMLIKRCGDDQTQLLLGCMFFLSFGRVCAMLTSSLMVVYAIMAIVIIALGIVNTAMSSAVGRLADADDVGGLFGIMEAVEGLAGLVGPALGGVLFRIDRRAPLVCIVVFYAAVFVAVLFFFRSTVVHHKKGGHKIAAEEAAGRKLKHS